MTKPRSFPYPNLCLFLHHLRFKLPTALQLKPNYVLLFYKGVKRFVDPEIEMLYTGLWLEVHPAGKIWAIVDTHQHLPEPCAVFKEGAFFVIGTSSPDPPCYMWATLYPHQIFYMQPWTF